MKSLFKDLALLWKAFRIARAKIHLDNVGNYRPDARHLIIYNQVRLDLCRAKHLEEELTGSVIHIAVAMAYRFRKKAA